MPVYKTIFNFQLANFQAPTDGWEDVLYQTAADLPTACTNAVTQAGERTKLLVLPGKMDSIRVSDEANPNVAKTIKEFTRYFYSPGFPSLVAAGIPELSWQAMLCRLYAAAASPSRQWMLRGIADQCTNPSTPSEVAVDADYRRQVRNYFTILKAGGWSMKALTRPPTQSQNIVAVNFANQVVTLKLNAAPLFVVGQRVHLYRLREFPGLQGEATVLAVNLVANTIDIAQGSARDDGPYRGKGYVTSISYRYVTIDNGQIEGITHRITGRPSERQVGRRKSRKALPR